MLNETYIAALTIAEAIGNFIPAIFGGISAAVSVQVGTHLGAGRFDEAKRNAGRIIVAGMAIAFAIGCTVFLTSNQIPQLFKISPDIRALASSMLRVQAVFYFLVTLNVTIFLIVRIGGDIKAALSIDSAFVWFGVIPLALLLSLVVKPPMLVFYLCIQLTELAKVPLTLHFFRHGRWVRNLT
jgi:Na+-driven multidrug efflux pump